MVNYSKPKPDLHGDPAHDHASDNSGTNDNKREGRAIASAPARGASALDNRDNPNRGHGNDNGRTNDNKREGRAIASAPASGSNASPAALNASTSLAALGTALNNVDTASVVGRSPMPILLFKSRENIWGYGQKSITPEEGSEWAGNPLTFRWGYVCFGNNNKPVERMVSVSQPKPNLAELPDTGFPWQDQWSVGMKCLNGADAGVEVIYKANTIGGIQAIAGLLEAVRDRLNSGQHGGKVAPIVLLEKDSYQHGDYGRIPTPVLRIIDWMALDGPPPPPAREPEPAPRSPPPAAEQPRRRPRVFA